MLRRSVIAAIGLGLSTFARGALAGSASLPLRPGVYVDVDTACRYAPSSARSWFGGGYVIQAPHANCLLEAVTRPSRTDHLVAKRRYENGDPTMRFEVVDQITIISSTEYVRKNEYGRFTSRWRHR